MTLKLLRSLKALTIISKSLSKSLKILIRNKLLLEYCNNYIKKKV